MGKFGIGKKLVVTGFLAGLIAVGMVRVQSTETIYVSPVDIDQLTVLEKIEIEKLRNLVKGNLTDGYMNEDGFLVKWLLEKDFEVEKAAELLIQNLEWRAAQKIETILEENWADMLASFPYSRATTDKFGRPLLYLDIGQWNIAKLIGDQGDSGRARLERYFYKILEESEQHVRNLRGEGLNVTQFSLIVNIDGFSLEKHGCIQCLHFYRTIGQSLAPNYPWASERISFVNVPYLFEMAWQYLSEQNKRSINILGREQPIWEQKLLETIHLNQLPQGLVDQQTQQFI